MNDVKQKLQSIIKTNYPAVLYINFKELGQQLLIYEDYLTNNINNLFEIRKELEEKGIKIIKAQDYMRAIFLPNSFGMMMLFKSQTKTKISKKQSHLSNCFILHLNQKLWKLMVYPNRKQNGSFTDNELLKAIEKLQNNLNSVFHGQNVNSSAEFIATQLAWLAFRFPNLCLYAFSPVSLSETVDCLHFILLEDGTAQMPSPEQIREYFLVTSRSILEVISEVRWQLFQRDALCSAVATIMARNMSHLIGSHIEPGIQNDINSFKEVFLDSSFINISLPPLSQYIEQREAISEKVQKNINILTEKALERYSLYRQKKMDFIARIVTKWPDWGIGYDFYKHCLFPFITNSILLHFVGYADGFTIKNIKFEIKIGDKEISEVLEGASAKPNEKNNKLSPLDLASIIALFTGPEPVYKTSTRDYIPLILKFRGGDVGLHAFNVILENIIRNTLKHNSSSIDKNYVIYIHIYNDRNDLESNNLRLQNSEDYVYVVISSSKDKGDANLINKIDKYICGPIIKETGEIEYEAWGIKEIKTCAAFLAGRGIEEIDHNKPDYIQAVSYQGKLGYCFVIPKYHYLGIVGGNNEQNKENK